MPATTTPVTVPDVRARKGGEPLVMVTAYDAPGARIADEAGVDMILVGDSLAMVVLGYEDTLQVTIEDMAHHTAAVARARPRPLIVGDLPWLSYHVSTEDTVRNAATLIRAGAQSVKLEGGAKRLPMIHAIIDAEVPVMGHLGLTPQSIHSLGGFRVQGKQADAAKLMVEDAVALADAGCFAIVLEAVPDAVAQLVTDAVARSHDRDRSRGRAVTARCWCSTTCLASRIGCGPSSCGATRRSRTMRSRPWRPSPATCARAASRRRPRRITCPKRRRPCLVCTAAEVLARLRER